MSSNRRVERFESLLRGELSQLLVSEVSDPILGSVSVSSVRVTKDLKLAWIYYMGHQELDEKEHRLIGKGFSRAASFLRRRIGEDLALRYVPELRFERDRHSEEVGRVISLMESKPE